ncbi:MAG: PEGA domain-containing protein [Blastocatellia bacterium]
MTPVQPSAPARLPANGGRANVMPMSNLTLYTESQANVVLTRLDNSRTAQPIKKQANQKSIAFFPSLLPGAYKLEVTLDGFKPISQQVEITKAPLALSAPLESKFGTLWILMGKQAGADVLVKLDGKVEKPEEVQLEQGIEEKRAFRLVKPAGVYSLEISKPGYKGKTWDQIGVISDSLDSFNVKNGRPPKNQLTVNLDRAVVRLTVASLPDARVYVSKSGESGRELRGQVKEQTPVQIDLLPGDYKLSVELDGYETFAKQIKLEIEKPTVEEWISKLEPISDAETSDDFSGDYWYPGAPASWQLDKSRGRLVRGDGVALFRRGQKDTHPFNYYSDMTLVFKVTFDNQKGAVWIARARDEKNYYRFELTTSRSSRGEKRFIFSICKDGNCVEKWSDPVIAKIETPDDMLTIKLVASGNELHHFIDVFSDPTEKMRPLGRVITDETFKVGGVGLSGSGGVEMKISKFLVIPKCVWE